MAQVNDFTLLCRKLKIETPASELKKALTHKSFYKNEKGNHNSRYVFCGMFAFKGLVAEILYDWIPLDGTQLQHALGNLFKPEILERIFVYYDLDKRIRHGIEFEADKHRHIFVYGFLGFLFVHAPEDEKRAFVNRHFLLPNNHLFQFETKNQDLEGQCNVLSRQLFGKKITITRTRSGENKWWQVTVATGETILAQDESVSYHYSRKKTLKKALLALAEKAQDIDRLSDDYEQRQQIFSEKRQTQMEQAKAEKLAAYQAKTAKKKAEREAVKAKQKEMKQLLDQKRKLAKANVKKRKEEKERQAAAAANKMTTMSANKRRHLEDKQK
jgi:hypothetical protein